MSCSKNEEGFPSGQRGQTVNLLFTTSVVRIHPPPLNVTGRFKTFIVKGLNLFFLS